MDGTAGTADDVCRVTTLTAARKNRTQALNKRAKLYETEKKARDKALKSSTDNAEEEKYLRDTKIQLKLRIGAIEDDEKQLRDEISTNETKISKAATTAESNKNALGKLKWDDLAGRTKLVRACVYAQARQAAVWCPWFGMCKQSICLSQVQRIKRSQGEQYQAEAEKRTLYSMADQLNKDKKEYVGRKKEIEERLKSVASPRPPVKKPAAKPKPLTKPGKSKPLAKPLAKPDKPKTGGAAASAPSPAPARASRLVGSVKCMKLGAPTAVVDGPEKLLGVSREQVAEFLKDPMGCMEREFNAAQDRQVKRDRLHATRAYTHEERSLA